MSYDIYIGERVTEQYDDGERYERVNRVELPDAPCFAGDELTGHGNSRHPGYSQWSDWCEKVGLHSLFFDKRDGIMRKHPGIVALTPAHLETVRVALKKWNGRHRDTPGWGDGQDPAKARLVWLEWWMAWALANCRQPAIYNS